MNVWKPTALQVAIIQSAARVESRLRHVRLEPAIRHNTAGDVSMNIAKLSSDPDWGDTDLYDKGTWAQFRHGVELTEDGRAIVDFYIYRLGSADGDLEGNVSVYFAGGRVTRIQGYPGDYGGE